MRQFDDEMIISLKHDKIHALLTLNSEALFG